MQAFLSALSTPEAWVAVLSLTLLELVLGIDNIVFITLLAGRLPRAQQAFARTLGLVLAVVTRIALLASVTWLTRLTAPVLSLFGQDLSIRDLVLLAGGLFLMIKSVRELSNMARNPLGVEEPDAPRVTLASVIFQIPLLDLVFSLDSVITAVGVSGNLPVMIAAVVLAMLVMIAASGPISRYLDEHPPLKLLAAAFLLLIGSTLVGEAFGVEVPRAFIYFTMLFAGIVMLFTVRAARTVIRQRVEEAGGTVPPPGERERR
ncbi:UPF0053 inner membrane protein YgdQ [Deinococcus carri]|uniref:UPF0053 inner membrane protein YgdQ n=1 Tax=Deinococcus carri TaxID=1211323 RepID=A0ABP9W4G4_9DEIO